MTATGGKTARPPRAETANVASGGWLFWRRMDGTQRRLFLANLITAAVVLIFGTWAALTSLSYGLFLSSGPGPGLFPFIITAPLTVLGVVWLVFCRRLSEPDDGVLLGVAADEDPPEPAGTLRVLMCVALTVLTMLVLEPIGYVLAVILYSVGLMAITAKPGSVFSLRRLVFSLLGAFVGSISSKYLFDLIGLALPPLPFGLQWLGL